MECRFTLKRVRDTIIICSHSNILFEHLDEILLFPVLPGPSENDETKKLFTPWKRGSIK